MWFEGAVANAVGIVAGGIVGLALKRFIPENAGKASELGLGVCTLLLGIKMGLEAQNLVLLILSVSVGGAVGTAWGVEKRLERWAKSVQARFLRSGGDRFSYAFVNSSILFCTGAMAIVGSIQAGAAGDNSVLYAKTTIDGLFAITFAAVYGAGVLLSAVPVLAYEGGLAALSQQAAFLSEPSMLKELSGVGGVLLAFIGLSLSGIRKVPTGDYLPALPLAIVLKLLWP
ncbi:DUF554 domain-containing protein [bacterium]|nr:DUF554 domain-containing protein [bacterium]